jgi:hypothetical protein
MPRVVLLLVLALALLLTLMLAFLERTWINDWLGWLALER